MTKKRLLFIPAAVFIGLAAVVHSCSREVESGPVFPDEQSAKEAVARAQKFLSSGTGELTLPDTYYKANGASKTRSSEVRDILAGAIEPDWSRARVWETDRVTGTEVPAMPTQRIGYATLVERMGDTVSMAVQAPHVRIIFNEHKDTNETLYFLATLLPDESYEGELSSLAVNPEGSDYWGISLYSYPDGTPAWGWRYENGEITNTLLFGDSDATPDPNVRIGMGIGSGAATTRAWHIIEFDDGSIYIFELEDIVVTGVVTKKSPDSASMAFDDASLGGSGSTRWEIPSGGGSGNGGKNTTAKVAPKAQKIFKNDAMTQEEWKKLEKLIEEIMADCMGGALYNALAYENNPLTFQFSNSSSVAGSFNIDTWTIKSENKSNSVFHEMFHAYQAWRYSKSEYDATDANREVEAYLAEYMYAHELEWTTLVTSFLRRMGL